MKQTTLNITGSRRMHCHGCERSVEFLLSDLGGVEQVDADHDTQHIHISFDPAQVAPSDMRAALRDLGYEITFNES